MTEQQRGNLPSLQRGKAAMSDVPEGYRISEVGVIPEDWEEERLGKECELITKGTTPTSLGKEFKDDGINFIKIESLEENGTIIKEKVAFIDKETNKLLKRSQLKENDVLVSIAGALGRIAIVKAEILPANTNQALAIVRLKPQTKLNRNYLFYFLNSARIKKHIDAINVQAAQANLSLENINDFTIFIPSLPEQQAIASALSDVDALITALEQLITKKRNIKQGAMQQLLTGEKRLPGFGGGWEVKKLREIADVKTGPFGSSLHERDYVDDGTPIITVEHLGERGVVHKNLPMVSDFDRKRLNAYVEGLSTSRTLFQVLARLSTSRTVVKF